MAAWIDIYRSFQAKIIKGWGFLVNHEQKTKLVSIFRGHFLWSLRCPLSEGFTVFSTLWEPSQSLTFELKL